jgi:hypothetical protein
MINEITIPLSILLFANSQWEKFANINELQEKHNSFMLNSNFLRTTIFLTAGFSNNLLLGRAGLVLLIGIYVCLRPILMQNFFA